MSGSVFVWAQPPLPRTSPNLPPEYPQDILDVRVNPPAPLATKWHSSVEASGGLLGTTWGRLGDLGGLLETCEADTSKRVGVAFRRRHF